MLKRLPLKIPEWIPGADGLTAKWPFSRWWRRYLSLRRYFWPTGSFVSSHSGCFPRCLKWPSPFLSQMKSPKKKKKRSSWRKTTKRKKKPDWRRGVQKADSPLTGAAFTHFIPFAKKTGAIVTGDLLPRWDGSNHFNAGDVLLTREELGGWTRRQTEKEKQKTKVSFLKAEERHVSRGQTQFTGKNVNAIYITDGNVRICLCDLF